MSAVYHRYLEGLIKSVKSCYGYAPYCLTLWVPSVDGRMQYNLEQPVAWDYLINRAITEKNVGNARYAVAILYVRHDKAGVIDQREILISPMGGMIDVRSLPFPYDDLIREVYIRQVLKREEGFA